MMKIPGFSMALTEKKRWSFSLVATLLIYFASQGLADSRSRTVSLFRYCRRTVLVDEHESYTVQLFGELFPVTLTTCQVMFKADGDIEHKLMYRVTSSNVYKINEEISLDSSQDLITFTSQEFITTTSPPKAINQERIGERFLNLSAFRTSGYIDSTFSVVVEIYGDEYHPTDAKESSNSSYVSGSITLGIALGIGCIVIIIIIVALYVKKSKFGPSGPRGLSPTAPRHRGLSQTSQQMDGNSTPMGYLTDIHQPMQPPPPFLPPYPPGPVGDTNIFTVHPHGGTGQPPVLRPGELPPSYDEAMKSGLREVTL